MHSNEGTSKAIRIFYVWLNGFKILKSAIPLTGQKMYKCKTFKITANMLKFHHLNKFSLGEHKMLKEVSNLPNMMGYTAGSFYYWCA